jgi:histidinol-phosphate aminotransferase
MPDYIRKEIREMKGYQLASHPDALKLNQNEIPYDIPGDLKAKVLERLVRIPWNRYPYAQPLSLREKLSQYLNCPSDSILIAPGSNILIQALMISTAVRGRVLTIDPTFSLYEIEGSALGNEINLIRLGENFSFPLELILQAIAKLPPSVIFLANPNAPTGNLFPKEAILEVIKAAPCLVVVDEAYCQFADYNLLEELPNYKNLVLLRTFSKAFGLGGVRIGFVLGAPETIQEVSKVVLPYCVSGINEVVAEAILEHPEIMEKRLTEIKIGRAWIYQNLLNLPGIKVYPSQTNFIIFQIDDGPKIFNALLAEGILVRDVSNHRSLPNTLRVTVGTSEENERFVKALEKVLK